MRARRLVSTPSVAATPVSRNTGATEDWPTCAISISLPASRMLRLQFVLLYDRSTRSGSPMRDPTPMKPSRLQPVEPAAPADADGVSLPAWIYRDGEFFERECQAIFRSSWRLVCPLSALPQPGDFHTFEFLGESVMVLRGEDGAVRAFHNVCRHRA